MWRKGNTHDLPSTYEVPRKLNEYWIHAGTITNIIKWVCRFLGYGTIAWGIGFGVASEFTSNLPFRYAQHPPYGHIIIPICVMFLLEHAWDAIDESLSRIALKAPSWYDPIRYLHFIGFDASLATGYRQETPEQLEYAIKYSNRIPPRPIEEGVPREYYPPSEISYRRAFMFLWWIFLFHKIVIFGYCAYVIVLTQVLPSYIRFPSHVESKALLVRYCYEIFWGSLAIYVVAWDVTSIGPIAAWNEGYENISDYQFVTPGDYRVDDGGG